jgi:peptidoglycan/LPS O-acetylase OafA/YrhL
MSLRLSVETISPLTSIRGAAALWVAYFHFAGIDSSSTDPYWLTFIRRGFLGVDIFFILSGFIMSYCYAHFFTTDGLRRNIYLRFLGLRLARIYPLHLFLLLVYLLLTFEVFLPHHAFAHNYEFQRMYWETFVQSLLLVQSWYIHHYKFWNDAAWTISVEWLIYLLFPFAIVVCMRLPKLAIAGLVILVYCLIALSDANDPLLWGELHLRMPCGGILRGSAGYLTGILVYRLHVERTCFSLPWKLIGNLCFMVIPIVVVSIGRVALILPVFAVFIYALAHPSNAGHRFWNSRPMIVLGDISYSIYMIQFFILAAFIQSNVRWTYITTLSCVLFTTVLVIFAFITYRFIEKPSRRYLRKRWLLSEAAEMPVIPVPTA